MYKQIKRLSHQSVVYGLGGVLNQFVGFLLIPIYSRYLTPEQYGITQLLTITSAIVLIFAQLGLSSALFRSALYDQECDIGALYSTAFYTLGGSALLMFVVGWLSSVHLSWLLFDTSAYVRLVKITFAAVALDTWIVVAMARLRIEGRALRYSIISFSAFATRLLFNVLFIVVMGRGVSGLVEANALQSLIFAFVYWWQIKDQLALSFSTAQWRNLIGFGVPIIPALLSSRVLVMCDRYFLRYYGSLADVGLYSLAYRIASVVSLVISAFQTAWPAVLFSVARTKDANRLYARVLTYLSLLGIFLALGVAVLAEDILRIFSTEAYYPASKVVLLLALSYAFYGAYFATNIGPLLERKTYYSSFIVGSAALFQIGLNFALIPRFGMMGAAWATALSYCVLPVLAVLISRRLYPVSYEYKRLFRLGA